MSEVVEKYLAVFYVDNNEISNNVTLYRHNIF